MKNMKIGESKAHRFFSGKGFYITLAISLIAVGCAAWIGINSAINNLESLEPQAEDNTIITEENEWALPEDFEVTAPQSNVPAESSSKSENVQGYILPLKGNILNAYSGDKMVKSKTLDDWVMHTGIDIEAKESTPVKSMAAGKVKSIENDAMWGTTVTISHDNDIQSYYANLKSAVNVRIGQNVKLGDVIGKVGKTAEIEQAEKSHLHFGVKKNGEWINPMNIIK